MVANVPSTLVPCSKSTALRPLLFSSPPALTTRTQDILFLHTKTTLTSPILLLGTSICSDLKRYCKYCACSQLYGHHWCMCWPTVENTVCWPANWIWCTYVLTYRAICGVLWSFQSNVCSVLWVADQRMECVCSNLQSNVWCILIFQSNVCSGMCGVFWSSQTNVCRVTEWSACVLICRILWSIVYVVIFYGEHCRPVHQE